MNQDEIALFKLDIFRTIMASGQAFDSESAAIRAEKVYERFYLGQSQPIGGSKRAKKR